MRLRNEGSYNNFFIHGSGGNDNVLKEVTNITNSNTNDARRKSITSAEADNKLIRFPSEEKTACPVMISKP